MKLRVIFLEPPYNSVDESSSLEHVITIKSPYRIIQEELGDTRQYETADRVLLSEDALNYETYCDEMNRLIVTAIQSDEIAQQLTYDEIIIEGFRQPPNFKTCCQVLSGTPLSCAPMTSLMVKDSSFGGALYIESIGGLANALHKKSNASFNVVLSQSDMSTLSSHDEARLASLNHAAFFRDDKSQAAIKPFIDDSLIGIKKSPIMNKLENPTYFYRETLKSGTPAELVLKLFFSNAAQQQNDYTCGPATIKMVANYFSSMQNRQFCGKPVENQDVWHEIDSNPEMLVAAQVNTTEADGSDIPEIRQGLLDTGLTVLDDNGISNEEFSETELLHHKELLWGKLKDMIKLGVPAIINMQDEAGCGHFEVITGIDADESIVLAEPGTALTGVLKFEHISKDAFFERWKNMSGEFHGRFMVISPNSTTTEALESILDGVPHCMNGEDKHRDQHIESSQKLN